MTVATVTSTPPFDLAAGDRTLYPADAATRKQLHPHTDSRVLVRPANPAAVYEDAWTSTVDERTGLTVQIRRTGCGLGCRCAAEVKAPPLPRKTTKFAACDKHAPMNAGETRRRLAEVYVEGGWARGGPCEGGVCRLWPGRDFYVESICYGEFPLDWTGQ